MTSEMDELRRRLAEVSDLAKAAALLEWDQMVMMPSGGAALRAEQIATVRGLAHRLFTADEVGELLAALASHETSLDPLDDEASLIRVARRDWEKARRVPTELEAELSRHASASMEVWATARANDDFASFRPWLAESLELKRRYVACFEPAADPYDPLLDDFEPGMRTDEVRAVFDVLQPALQALVAEAPVEDEPRFVHGSYPKAAQEPLGLELTRAFGIREGAFRLDPTIHPFCSAIAVDDIRLTTRYAEDDLHGTCLFSTMHEVGHGLYEHGVAHALERTPLASGCSSALHESQSRLWENVIGRSRPFWRWFYPQVQAAFPATLAGVGVDEFHRAVNRARPSYIRVDADETTYGLHIILRFELEQRLLFGGLDPADLPEAWNTRFEELLGIPVPNDTVGCLQDVHWSAGLFGYFPTYQLGNVLSAQIWERLRTDLLDVDELIGRGEFGAIGEWLRDRLYALGRKLTPAETIEHVCGGPIDPEPYLRYLRDKNASLVAA
jgi:carboxypeptidase Taq